MDDDTRNAIEKALERARQDTRAQQTEAAGTYTGAEQGSEPPPPPRKIIYDKTRVEKVAAPLLEGNRLIAGAIRDQQADIFRMLRAQVLKRLSTSGGSSIAVCSSKVAEGKTLTAANLAISMAMDPNHTVLLVDLDLRRPRIQEYFALQDVTAGLCDYLEGSAELAAALVNPGIEGLVLLPVRRPVLNSSELLSSPRMLHLLSELKGRYPDRIVIFDLPPLLASDDSLVVLPHIDASLLVIREGGARAGEIARSLRLLENHNLLGTVLNDSAEENLHPYY